MEHEESWLKLEIETLRAQRDRLREAIKAVTSNGPNADTNLDAMHTAPCDAAPRGEGCICGFDSAMGE